MIALRKFTKAVSFILLICVLSQIGFPSALALTSGPTSPEASSFEPVDTTDMVNPLTGNFVYNLPLLEVPGPEGSYPLSLSHHAGLQPNEDSSWVGFGWTLNPGAVNRSVNAYPDDWYLSKSSRRDYWEGGVRTASRVGLNIPIGGAVSVSFGLSFSNDTYEGRSYGWDAGVGFGIPNTPLYAGVGLGVSTEGDVFAFGSIGIQAKADNGMSAGWGLNFYANLSNFKGIEVGVGMNLSYKSQPLLGVSMNSDGTPSYSIGGISASTVNKKAGSITTHTKTTSVNLVLVTYNRQKTRYWSDETSDSYISGSLYPSYMFVLDIPDNYAFDGYNLQEEGLNVVDNPNSAKQQGGAFPSFDLYQVSAQGLGGVMRPYQFKGEVHQQNHWTQVNSTTRAKEVTYYSNAFGVSQPQFRFENDFSNNYLQNYPDFPNVNSELLFFDPPYSGPIVDDYDWFDGFDGGQLAGSKSISYFNTKNDGTVWDTDPNRKFIYPVVNGLDRRAHTYQSNTHTHIAGFSITNPNGMTYHYNLPAYSYNEEIYQERKDQSQGLMFNRQTRPEGYAYTWLLTAVTGPDYVDRGVPGVLDAQDYGYWVSFEYGKWSDKYVWRNPSEGYHTDDDNEFKNMSIGMKEIYYLNSVKTRSHTAIFEKDVKADGKGVSPESFNKNWSSQNSVNTNYQNQGIFNVNSSSTMKLDKIYLFRNEDVFSGLATAGGPGGYIPSGRTVSCVDCEVPNNVIDKNDITSRGRADFESKALRIIDFTYDYSLAKGTVNSFDFTSTSAKQGKLTLKSVKFRGKGGEAVLPSTDFEYDFNENEAPYYQGNLTSSSFQGSYNAFEVGDMLVSDDGIYCVVVSGKGTPIGSSAFYTLINSTYNGSSQIKNLRKTKNPPYNKDFYDLWGMYKSDFQWSVSENLARSTTSLSNKTVDAWSLRKVRTSLGAELKVNYEGDTYGRSVLNYEYPFVISNFTHQTGNQFYFDINLPTNENLSEYYKVGDKLDFLLLKELRYQIFTGFPVTYQYSVISSDTYQPSYVTSLSGNRIYMQVPDPLRDFLNLLPSSLFTKSFRAGNLRIRGGELSPGGGIRVASIEVDNLDGQRSIVSYSYNMPNSAVSSGVTTYKPVLYDVDLVAAGLAHNSNASQKEEVKNNYRRQLYKYAGELINISRDIPTPGVMYEYVGIQRRVVNQADGQIRDMPVKTELQFEVFRKNMVGRQDASPRRSAPRESGGGTYYTRNLVLKKFISNVGALKKMVTYNSHGNKLSERINHYLHDGLENLSHKDFMESYEQRLVQFKKQGLIKERFSEVKSVWTGNNSIFDLKATMSAREDYPAVMVGQTEKDYVSGTTVSSSNIAFDFYSGDLVKTAWKDSYGNKFMQEVFPAYKVYPEMGIKSIYYGARKNMLSQTAGGAIYKVDDNNNPLGVVAATASTWGNAIPALNLMGESLLQNGSNSDGEVWRQQSFYQWAPDGISASGYTPFSEFNTFNWSDLGSISSSWKRTMNVSLYDVHSRPLESSDVNGFYTMSKLGYKNSKLILNGGIGNYDEFAFSGAEESFVRQESPGTVYFSGNVGLGTGTITSLHAHTGAKSILLNSGHSGFIYPVNINRLNNNRDYAIAVWVKSATGDISGAKLFYTVDGGAEVLSATNSSKFANGWYLLEMTIPASAISGSILSVGCRNVGSSALYADDFRFQPLNANSMAYVYDPITGELTYALDNNNLFTKYEYDAGGRLTKVYKEVLGKNGYPMMREIIYNYKRSKN